MNIKNLIIILITIQMFDSLANASEAEKTNNWGSSVEGVQVLLKLDENAGKEENNKQQVLVVTVTNNSKGNVILSLPNLRPAIWFSITSPSGADLSTKEPIGSVKGSHVVPPVIKPQQSLTLRFPVNEICPLRDVGDYKYVANSRILYGRTNSVVKSEAVDVIVTARDIENAAKRNVGL